LSRTRAADAGTRVPLVCLAVFAVVFAVSAVSPHDRQTWLLEQALPLLAVPLAILTHRRFRFSDRAYVQMTIFLILHTVGSYYTYSEVPVGDWAKHAIDLSRNHYDRLVHASFGLLMFRPLLEVVARSTGGAPRLAGIVLTLSCVIAVSTIYELIEWAAAVVVDPDAGIAFVGTQGDVWDAQKDTGLATVGGLLAAAFELARPARHDAAARPARTRRRAAGQSFSSTRISR
jgi:putative membrane protein